MRGKAFWACAMHISDDVKSRSWKGCDAWIVPTKLNPFRYIDDPRGLNRNGYQLSVQEGNGRKENE